MGPQDSSDGGRGGSKNGSGWDVGGWVRWLEGLRGSYERRMQTMCSVLEKGKYYVKTGRRPSIDGDEWSVVEKTLMYDFIWPLGGMFIWVKLNLRTHPLWKKAMPRELSHALWVFLTAKPFLVLVCPGDYFSPSEEIREEKGWQYFRICFAAVEEEDVESTSQSFTDGCNSFWGKKNLDDIKELLRND
jgi:DNA-binding transcriptional MocR family regulator